MEHKHSKALAPEGLGVSGLLSEALKQAQSLLRTEAALARAEILDKMGQTARAGMMLVLAALFAGPSLVVLLLALSAFLVESGMTASASYLITAIVGLSITAVLAAVGTNALKSSSLVPERTMHQLHRDVAAIKKEVRTVQ